VAEDLLRLPGGVEARIHVTGDESGGAFVLLTDAAPPGWALPPHRHANESETIHITRGALWLEVEGARRELRAGDTAFVARGALHSGGTLGDERVERVVVFSPAGMERFFTALAATSDPAAMLELATAHGWAFA
jgi:quercetin dioxygenase-like cupin family protein